MTILLPAVAVALVAAIGAIVYHRRKENAKKGVNPKFKNSGK